ncbi:MAG: DNA starvation/stationary phase protection protein Dps [Chloroflexi bacterium]|nr:DNA starvation/stationary phase protection protein Dps [Anaerolineaceae bacterium]NMB91110.1 DNA starvation/stationary phase protection protein Dps [Chloroflexota bacterium]
MDSKKSIHVDGTTKTLEMFTTHVDIPQDNRVELINMLNQSLADVFDLYSQTKQAHWNVKGPNFFQLHELFDTLAGNIFPFVDMIAERVTALGGVARGTTRMAAGASHLDDFPEVFAGMDNVSALAERYAAVANTVRQAIDTSGDKYGDMDTADLYTEISRELDKALWFLEAHLQVKE